MKKYKILSTNITEEFCSDLVGKDFLGEKDEETECHYRVYVDSEWLKSVGYNGEDRYILMTEEEVKEII